MSQPTTPETPAMPDGLSVELSRRLGAAKAASGMDALSWGAVMDRVFAAADADAEVASGRANLAWEDLPADLRAHLARVESAASAGIL